MYNSLVRQFSITAARQHLAEVIESVGVEPVMLLKHGEPAAVMISPAMYDEFVDAIEEREDIDAFDAAMEDEEPNLPWDEVRAELGWR